MNIAVRSGRVEGGVGDKMVAEQSCGHRESGVVGVIAAVGGVQFHERIVGRSLCAEGYRAAESAVTVGGRADTALDLNAFQKSGVAVHIRPKDTLVLRRVKRNAIDRDVDSGVSGTSDPHIGRAGSETVLAPGQHAWSRGEKERQFLSGSGKVLERLAVHVGHRIRGVLLGADTFDNGLIENLGLGCVRLTLSVQSLWSHRGESRCK